VLTGVGVNTGDPPHLKPEWQPLYRRDGAFEFNPARHDFGPKELMGRAVSGKGMTEVENAVRQIVREPACATFISRKIAVYFVADDPPHGSSSRWRRPSGTVMAILSRCCARCFCRPNSAPRSVASSKIRCATWFPPCASPMTASRLATPGPCSTGSTAWARHPSGAPHRMDIR